MFRRILIANRGEVAARVLRTCQRLGIAAVAVSTEPDAELSWLRGASAVVPIGGPKAYLDGDALLAAARAERCSALHPGWGFLSENAGFAARCEAAGITFIGPRPRAMRQMGDKALARATMTRLGLLPIPGSEGVVEDLAAARRAAAAMGFPILLKALAGGGGRGMRKVYEEAELEGAFNEASAEAAGAFGDGRLYVEKLIERGRHIELQVLGDGERCVVVGSRECSMQRRHQKLIEEGPAPGVPAETMARAIADVERATTAIGYRGAGTVEMLLDADTDQLWFMEMNTRLQVEHTVTEAVTGLDLVEQQLKIAANHRLNLQVETRGHAIECRINAEDPTQGFRPAPGRVSQLVLPQGEGIRVDTHLASGDRIPPHYDSMIAKIIAWGPDRPAAIERMLGALGALVVEGVPTTAALHAAILRHPDFRAGRVDTRFVEREMERLLPCG